MINDSALPVISVMMVSYNHERFIAQALESVINQKTTYSFEIVISDDCSTDRTRDIIESYVLKYPDIIKAHFQEINIGMGKNWLYALSNCKGEIIALLEGDDYWVSDFKLQKQVSFLLSNNDYVICFNRVYEQSDTYKEVSPLNPWIEEKTFSIDDLASNNFMHTNSVVFKSNYFLNNIPNWFSESPAVDFVIHMLTARYGLIKYFPDLMGVYRKFTGVWSTQVRSNQIKKVITVLNYLLSEDFNAITKNKIDEHKSSLINSLFLGMLNSNDFSYTNDMQEVLRGEPVFVQYWMLNIYPNRIKQIVNSRSYRFVQFLSKSINFFSYNK